MINSTYTYLVIFRNELKNKSVSRYKVIGIVSELIYSKEVFKRNEDIKDFLKKVFVIEFKEYVMKSRTLIVARVGREILKDDNSKIKKELLKFLDKKIEDIKTQDNLKNFKNDFDGWIK